MTGFQGRYFSRKRTFQQYLYSLFLAGTCILMWDEVTLNLFLKLITDTDSIIKALLYKPKLFHVFCRLFYTWILFLYDVWVPLVDHWCIYYHIVGACSCTCLILVTAWRRIFTFNIFKILLQNHSIITGCI